MVVTKFMNGYYVLLNAEKFKNGNDYSKIRGILSTYQRLQSKAASIHIVDVHYLDKGIYEIIYRTELKQKRMKIHKTALPQVDLKGLEGKLFGNAILLDKKDI